MGSPLSPVITDIVMQDLEESVLRNFKFTMLFYYRYLDDLVMAVPTAEIDHVFSAFNSFPNNPKIQFTIEIGHNIINFTTIIIKNNKIIFD